MYVAEIRRMLSAFVLSGGAASGCHQVEVSARAGSLRMVAWRRPVSRRDNDHRFLPAVTEPRSTEGRQPLGERQLSSVLTDFARTMVTDFPIEAILDRLVERIVDILPVSAAGVTLIEPDSDPRYIAASNAAALEFEQLQTELGEGPCMLAFDSGHPVEVPDLRADDRFPTFAGRALAAGMAAVFTFPLHHGRRRFGALDLYRDVPGALSPEAVAIATTLADSSRPTCSTPAPAKTCSSSRINRSRPRSTTRSPACPTDCC